MASRISGTTIEEIHTLFRWGALGTWTDGQLMAQFVGSQEASEAAFRVLIHRHGPMVLGICRRILGEEHAAEDAFQATFLVLVKKARALRDCNLLANWLYGVAVRVARKEKARGARRRVVERRAVEQTARPGSDLDSGELLSVIDEEVHRLPERYRLPWVLCHVEGLRHDQAAERLGCPVGTVESRLSRARERLRSRLTRRGLAPTASALGPILRPPVYPSLVEATLQVAIGHSAHRTAVVTTLAAGLVERVGRLIPPPNAAPGTFAAVLVTCAGIASIGLSVFRAVGDDLRTGPPPAVVKRPSGDMPSAMISQREPPPPRRSPVALARMISGITIDGRLDDWPKNLHSYPIANQLRDHPNYDRESRAATGDPEASFRVGYDPNAGVIYLAVEVRDPDRVVNSKDPWHTDAVEVYIDGAFSERRIPEPPGDWKHKLDAATMPVLQYVGLPGQAPAYDDPAGANPALVYGRIERTTTRMRFQRRGDLTTYEWAIQAFDSYPDQPTRLLPGKRLGLDVVVVDKDRGDRRPAWMSWGASPDIFKGCDAGSLGELVLAGGP
jgi:RNA polymerase sigma factor (sigma-70 family)